MRILISATLLLLLSLSAPAQFKRNNPLVSVQNPAFIRSELQAPDFSASGNRTLAIDPSLPERLQHALDSLYAKTTSFGKHGVAAAIIVPGLPMWTGSVGESYPGVLLTSEHLFEIASNTKTFTTAFIMQLAEEGKLSLSDSLWKWLPPYANIDSTITIRQLLEHSSGIYDYLNDDTSFTLLTSAYFEQPEKVWAPNEILTEYIGKPNFKAGKSYKYSNTNFLLLGLIAENAAGANYATEIRRRFLDPLTLSQTFVGWKDSIVGEFTHNWFTTANNQPMLDLGDIEKTAQLSMAGAAGGNVSAPADLAVWVKALYEGSSLLADSSKAQMIKVKTWPDGTRYGLGTARVPYGTKSFYGHTGGLLGFYSDMFNNPKDSVTFVIYMNSGSFEGDVSINDYALALLNEIYKPAASVASRTNASFEVSISPNPFKERTTVRFVLPEASVIRIGLYNALGQEVTLLSSGSLPAGEHRIDLPATGLPIGAYTLRLSTIDANTYYNVLLSK